MNLSDIDHDLIEPQRLAGSVIDHIKIERRRPGYTGRALTARDALTALKFEAQLVAVAAQNVAHGLTLQSSDLTRLMLAWSRITAITEEAGV